MFSLSYALATLKGKLQPNKVTWLIWALAPLISAFAAISSGVSWAVLPVFMSGFGPLLVFGATFLNKKAYWAIARFDYICGLVSILALIVWYFTKNPDLAIILAILADVLAGLPTLVKGWKFPQTENGFLFLGTLFSAATSFSEIHHWTFAEIAFPIYLMLICLLMFAVIEGRRKYLKIKK
jgi:hypothetical protein